MAAKRSPWYHHLHFKKREKGRTGELQAGEPQLHAWEDYGADLPGRDIKVMPNNQNCIHRHCKILRNAPLLICCLLCRVIKGELLNGRRIVPVVALDCSSSPNTFWNTSEEMFIITNSFCTASPYSLPKRQGMGFISKYFIYEKNGRAIWLETLDHES